MMITFILNRILKLKGSIFWVKGNNIYRKLPFGMSYVSIKCDSPEQAERITNQLTKASK
jgi:hypothetical protein